MALEVEIHALAETIRPQQRVHHTHHLGALLVHGRSVEIVDLDIGIRPHRMGHRPGILRELRGAQATHVVDARIGRRAHVGGELLVAQDGQSFLEGKLEPVAAGDAVARPVVEIFVTDDGLDRMIVEVGRRFRIGQHELRIEDVQPLVLHRTHVEVVDGDDHECVEVVFESVHVLVPLHRLLERFHRVLAARHVAGTDVDAQRHLAPGAGREPVLQAVERSGDQREEIGRLGKRIFPGREVPAAVQRAAVDQVAVGQQHRRQRLVGHDAGRVARHHVGTVEEVGDAAEALGLALRAEKFARFIETGQLGIVLRPRARRDLQGKAVGHAADRQRLRRHLMVDRPAIEADRHEVHLLAVEHQISGLRRGPGIAPHRKTRHDVGRFRRKRNIEIHGLDQERWRRIIDATNRAGGGGHVLADIHGILNTTAVVRAETGLARRDDPPQSRRRAFRARLRAPNLPHGQSRPVVRLLADANDDWTFGDKDPGRGIERIASLRLRGVECRAKRSRKLWLVATAARTCGAQGTAPPTRHATGKARGHAGRRGGRAFATVSCTCAGNSTGAHRLSRVRASGDAGAAHQ